MIEVCLGSDSSVMQEASLELHQSLAAWRELIQVCLQVSHHLATVSCARFVEFNR